MQCGHLITPPEERELHYVPRPATANPSPSPSPPLPGNTWRTEERAGRGDGKKNMKKALISVEVGSSNPILRQFHRSANGAARGTQTGVGWGEVEWGRVGLGRRTFIPARPVAAGKERRFELAVSSLRL